MRMGAEILSTGVSAPLNFFDPLNLSAKADDALIRRFRAAELKHGRVCMLAALGTIVQSFNTGILPNPTFSETNPVNALIRVYHENPSAFIQIIIAIAAVEVLGASIEYSNPNGRPGDFGWDPAGIRPQSEEDLDVMQLKELNNGRLAMVSVLGIFAQVGISGHGYPFV